MGGLCRSYPFFNPLPLGLIGGLTVGHSRQETLHRGQEIGGTEAGLKRTTRFGCHVLARTCGKAERASATPDVRPGVFRGGLLSPRDSPSRRQLGAGVLIGYSGLRR